MKRLSKPADAQPNAHDRTASLPLNQSLADRFAAVQEAADKIGPVDPSFDQKTFFDAL